MVTASGCSANITANNSTATPNFVTATLAVAPTFALAATSTPLPPSPAPTLPPMDGTTTTQLNVRSEPSTAGNNLGIVPAFSKIQVLGKEENGTWLQIVFAESPNGKGWITAMYVQMNAAVEVPVVEIEAGSGPVVSGLVIQGLNVRSGPGVEYESLGTLVANDVVLVTGKDANGAWIQIEFRSEVGWVASEFLKIKSIDALPITADTAQATSATADTLPAIVNGNPALPDGDSSASPLISIVLATSKSQAFQFNGEISSPQGDNEDWVQFTPQTNWAQIDVTCSNNNASADIWNNGSIAGNITCNEKRLLNVQAGESYLIQMHMDPLNDFTYLTYTLKVGIFP